MKIMPGVYYFPRVFTEAQCPFCSKILEWIPTEAKNRVRAECCDKIFTATLNYVGITIDDVEGIEAKKEGKEENEVVSPSPLTPKI
jgi:hypothetical protein